MNKVYVFIGPSGCGKSSAVNYLKNEYGFYEHISHTTREKREKEKHGKDYYFVTPSEFENIEMLEYVEYAENKYGVAKNNFIRNLNLNKVSMIVTEIHGALEIKKAFPEQAILIFIDIEPDFAQKNMRKRGDSVNAILKRIEYDKTINARDNWVFCDYFIVNDKDFLKLIKNIETIIEKESSVNFLWSS